MNFLAETYILLLTLSIPTNFFDLTNYSPRDLEIISMQLKSLDIEILNKYNDESIIIETIIFKHFFQDEYKTIMNSKSKLESALYFNNGNYDNFDIRNIILSLKNGSIVIENRNAAKRIKYLVIFLIFNPNINEYNFNNQINPFGRRSQEFNECILEL